MAQRPLIGVSPDQVSTNGMLGDLAFQDSDSAYIEKIRGRVRLDKTDNNKEDTAVDVFVYDTGKDSDGGAWRKRTQNTSWYNETLNTATRGSRREFPSVAVIVLEIGNNGNTALTIYDGDDPDLPMWMTFISNSGSYLQATCNVVFALNGEIVVGRSGAIRHWNYINECAYSVTISSTSKNRGNILQRNAQSGWYQVNTNRVVGAPINDVTMTVLPNAPIDDTTGLPVPTIAAATDGGVSVFRDNGTVVDYTYQVAVNTNANNVYLSETGRLQYSSRSINNGFGYYLEYDKLSEFNVSTEPNVVLTVSQTGGSGITKILPRGAITSDAITKDYTALGFYPSTYTDYQGGLFLHKSTGDVKESDEDPNDNFIGAHIRPDYNTGWMFGDCKLAALSDTDDTNVTGTELVTNGTFDSNTNNWTATNATLSIVSNTLKVDDNGSNSAAYQAITTVIGETYTISFDVVEITGLTARVHVSTNQPNAGYTGDRLHESTELGSHAVSFIATGTTTYIQFSSESTYFARYDNISVRIADRDRSLNNNGLQVFGTVTKNPVATGADLISYSTGGSGNYLRQPYNSDLDFGKNSFYIMCWVKIGSGNGMLWHRAGGDGDLRCEFHSSQPGKPRFYMYGGGTDQLLNFYSSYSIADESWHQVVWVKSGARYGKLYVDGVLDGTQYSIHDVDVSAPGANFTIGARADSGTEAYPGEVSLFRIGEGEPSAEQIQKMYVEERALFQENAKSTLYGTSDDVKAVAYDEKTELLHVGTSDGRSDFNGLRRINNTTTAVTTAISAYDGSIVQQ